MITIFFTMIPELILTFLWLSFSPDISLWYYNVSNTEIVGDEIHSPGMASAGEMRLMNQSIVVQDVLKNESILHCTTQNICQGDIAHLSSSAKWYFGWLANNEYDRIDAQSVEKQEDFVSLDFGEKMPDFPIKMMYPRYE